MGEVAAIKTVSLTREFDGRVELDHVALRIERGEVFGFLGPKVAGHGPPGRSGCGVSTLVAVSAYVLHAIGLLVESLADARKFTPFYWADASKALVGDYELWRPTSVIGRGAGAARACGAGLRTAGYRRWPGSEVGQDQAVGARG